MNGETLWPEELELAVKANKIYQEKLGTNYPCGIINLYQTLFPDELLPGEFEQEHYIKIADQMIFIYQDYDYTDMPPWWLGHQLF